MRRQNILFDGTVFALAQVDPEARTGIFFLLRDLVMTLASSPDVHLSLSTSEEYMPLMTQGVQGGPLEATLNPRRRTTFGSEPWALLCGFHPAHPDLFKMPQVTVYQMVYDLTFHARPEVTKPGMLEFENALMGALASQGHAVCISENTRRDAVTLFGIPQERTHVVYPALRNDLQETPEGLGRRLPPVWTGLPPGSEYVLALSTLEPRKNLATSLKAFVTACELAPAAPLYFLVAGLDGWGNQMRLFDEVPAHLKNRVRLLGYVNDPEVPQLIEGALCLLYPSIYEGFGLPPLEAMSRGVPVIVSNAGSLPEVVGDAGVVTDVFDHVSMGQTIARWILNPAEREIWAARGREQAKRFSWRASADKLVEIMRTVERG